MKCKLNSVLLARVAIALCIPLSVGGQTPVAISSGQQVPQPTPEVVSDVAKPLEGRLFFSAEERQRMDRARKRGLLIGEDGQSVEPPTSVLNGFVKRSDGNISVWVDGVPKWNANSKSADALVPSDVGGPAAYLKASIGETVAAAPKHKVRAKKAVKPRVKKKTKPRLLP